MSDWAIWGALILVVPTGIGAIPLLAARARVAWRDVKDTRGDVVLRLDRLSAEAQATAERAAVAGDTAELQESFSRLRLSLARLAVLRAALDESRAVFGRVTGLVPHK
jgi:hypothetical protein